jgi:hypothetical protein
VISLNFSPENGAVVLSVVKTEAVGFTEISALKFLSLKYYVTD